MLSAREIEVLRLVAAGKTNPQIGHELQVAHDTVRSHMQRLSAKLGVSGRAAIVAAAYERGWLRLPESLVLAQAEAILRRRQLKEAAAGVGQRQVRERAA
jgi:DNA-binding CsgD family transcriptional regulator